jgi:hypothetical protein
MTKHFWSGVLNLKFNQCNGLLCPHSSMGRIKYSIQAQLLTMTDARRLNAMLDRCLGCSDRKEESEKTRSGSNLIMQNMEIEFSYFGPNYRTGYIDMIIDETGKYEISKLSSNYKSVSSTLDPPITGRIESIRQINHKTGDKTAFSRNSTSIPSEIMEAGLTDFKCRSESRGVFAIVGSVSDTPCNITFTSSDADATRMTDWFKANK